MTTSPNYPSPPTDASSSDPESIRRFARQVAQAVQLLMRGKSNNTGDITLSTSTVATTFVDVRLTSGSSVNFDPKTANAAAEIGAGTMYVLTANRNDGTWTITHASNAQNDRTFRFAITG